MPIASRRHERHNHIAAIRGGELLLMRYRPPAIGAPILREPAYLFASFSILSSSHIIKRFGGVRQPAAAMPQTAAQTDGIFQGGLLLRCKTGRDAGQFCWRRRNQLNSANRHCSSERRRACRIRAIIGDQGGVVNWRSYHTKE